MDQLQLFTAALMLEDPWEVIDVKFLMDENQKPTELHIYISYPKGSKFLCQEEGCGCECGVYDAEEKVWRHLNFFQYKTYIHAKLPRIECPEHGVKTYAVPWARPRSGFTLLFEAWVVELAKHMPVDTVAGIVDEHDTRLWRFIKHYVEEARKLEDYSDVAAIGVDETSKKGHNYITVFVDHDERKVIYVTDGKDAETVDRFAEDLSAHSGDPDKIELVTCDMSLGFKAGLDKNFKNHTTIIDKFHVVKHCTDAVDKTRKEEVKTNEILRGTKYLWLKNEENLSDRQKEKKISLSKLNLKTSRAYAMKLELQDIYTPGTHPNEAERRLKDLLSWMMHSRLNHMKEFAKMVRSHWDDIMNYFHYQYTNAILEGINSVIQMIKTRARGFRNPDYFKTMIYLVCGKLKLELVVAKF